MITLFGMSNEIGPRTIKEMTNTYLGSDGRSTYLCSDNYRQEVDEEISKYLKDELKKAKTLLTTNRDEIKELAKVLFEKETLTGEEFKELYENMKK